jgi:hypothetical protein
MRNTEESKKALRTFHEMTENYNENELYLDDIQNAILGDLSLFEKNFGKQLYLVNGKIGPDLLINILMLELKSKDQVKKYILAELNDKRDGDEVFQVFSIASGFDENEISDCRFDDSPEISNCNLLMEKWSKNANDSSRFTAMILDRFINRVFVPKNIIESIDDFIMVNGMADAIVGVQH